MLEVGKKYKTSRGRTILVIGKASLSDKFICRAYSEIEEPLGEYFYTIDGKIDRYNFSQPHPYDIVFEVVKYRKYK